MIRWASILATLVAVLVLGTAVVFLARQLRAPAESAIHTPSPSASTTPTTTQAATLDDLITLSTPLPGSVITSPLTITGRARGNWFFEASAPVELRDATGMVIAQGHIQAQGDWMTTDYVPFTDTLTFATPTAATGTLVLQNDNPSGDPSRQKELDIPVRFH